PFLDPDQACSDYYTDVYWLERIRSLLLFQLLMNVCARKRNIPTLSCGARQVRGVVSLYRNLNAGTHCLSDTFGV
ncbi:unnamed protein product, partial [Bubo scandiacus]